MKFLTASLCSLVVSAAAVLPAPAGWDNVFQPTLFERFRKPVTTSQYYVAPVVVAQYAPPPVVVAQSSPCNTCEEKKCTTSYVQRSYYQPVTTYETKTVMEQVTTVQTSYYYAPVVSYRYSSYYDPSSCCAQQVAVPVTSYELRQKQCPVQSWVSRCVQVPVQGVQKVDYWQPQTTCCTTTQGAPIMGVAPPVQVQPAQPLPEGPPSITPSRTQGMSNGKPDMYNRYYYPPIENPAPEIRGSGSSFQPKLGAPMMVSPDALKLPTLPPVKFDRIAVGPDSHVEGQVVRADNSPKPNAKVMFINASTGKRQTITTNPMGRFQTDLPAGSWHVYLHGADDVPIHVNRIDVNGTQSRTVSLVSRSN